SPVVSVCWRSNTPFRYIIQGPSPKGFSTSGYLLRPTPSWPSFFLTSNSSYSPLNVPCVNSSLAGYSILAVGSAMRNVMSIAGICGHGLYDIDQVPVHCDCDKAANGNPI